MEMFEFGLLFLNSFFPPALIFEVFDLCSGVLSDLLSSRQCQIKKELHLFCMFKAVCAFEGSQQPPVLQLCHLAVLLVVREFLLKGVGIPKKTPNPQSLQQCRAGSGVKPGCSCLSETLLSPTFYLKYKLEVVPCISELWAGWHCLCVVLPSLLGLWSV